MTLPREVYVIRHNKTKRCYVGSSKSAENRFKNHLFQLRAHKHLNEYMQKDFDIYGEDYTLTVIDKIANYEEKNKEYDWMVKLCSGERGKGYNYKDPFIKALNRRKQSKSNELELIEGIQQSNNPEQAIILAIEIFSSFI